LTKIFAMLLVTLLIACPQANAQEWAKAKLEKSPRHLEWVDLKRDVRTIKCFVAYPESRKKSTSVLVIHEIFGLSDWVRQVCDDLAAEGYIAIAPDLLSGKPGEETAKYSSVDETRKAVSSLPREQVSKDLKAVADYVSKLPSANGHVATAGFCWGGTQVWLAATTNKNLKANFVFYGTPNASIQEARNINAPVYGFYGEKDNRVTSTVDDTTAEMEQAVKVYEPHIYSDAGHGFMRTGQSPEGNAADKKARHEAWATMSKVLHGL
jgi:carboxymethylenebutenolidase